MNYGVISQTNSKGQLVIPKNYRDALGINPSVPLQIILKADGLYVRPIEQLVTKYAGSDLYLELLDNTAGAWTNDNWDKTSQKRKVIEKKASKSRKRPW